MPVHDPQRSTRTRGRLHAVPERARPLVAAWCSSRSTGTAVTRIRGTVVTRPSDATGERPIADAILIRPN